MAVNIEVVKALQDFGYVVEEFTGGHITLRRHADNIMHPILMRIEAGRGEINADWVKANLRDLQADYLMSHYHQTPKRRKDDPQ